MPEKLGLKTAGHISIECLRQKGGRNSPVSVYHSPPFIWASWNGKIKLQSFTSRGI